MVFNKKEYMKQYWEKHKKQHRENAKRYRENHKEYYKQYAKQYRENHKEYYKQYEKNHKDKRKIYNIRNKYNLPFEKIKNLYQQQEGKCAICHKDISLGLNGEKRTACIDHNHDNGKIRGLLCNSCNLLIGYLEIGKQINPLIIQSIISYIEGE